MNRLLSLILALFATSALAVDIPVRNPSSGGKISFTGTVATMKQYVAGTAYTNGTPSITSAQAGFNIGRVVLMPYQTNDGAWHLKLSGTFNMTGQTTVAYGSIFRYGTNFTISGVTFKNSTTYYQPGAAMGSNGTWLPSGCYVNANTGTVDVTLISAAASSMVNYAVVFDVELDSKPTWAD